MKINYAIKGDDKDLQLPECQRIVIDNRISIENYERSEHSTFFKISGVPDDITLSFTIHKGCIYLTIPNKEKAKLFDGEEKKDDNK